MARTKSYSARPTIPERRAKVRPAPVAGNYSFVLLRHVVDGKVQTKLIDGEFYAKASESQTPYRYEVSGLLDLDGDGRLEIIIYSAYYEGATVTVWRFGEGKLHKVLEIGCGA